MRRKELESLTTEQRESAVVIVRRIEQYSKWRVTINGEPIVTADEIDCLFADLERVSGWLRDAGINHFTVENAINLS